MRQRIFSLGMGAVSALVIATAVLGPRMLTALAASRLPRGFQWRADPTNGASTDAPLLVVRSSSPTAVRSPLGGTASPDQPCGEAECAVYPGVAAGTLIATPRGAVPVENLHGGSSVWSRTEQGERIVAEVMNAARLPSPQLRMILRLQLSNGTEVAATRRARLADGREIGELAEGDPVGGERVVGIRNEPYPGEAVYDLLPGSETGVYWANGILFRSSGM